MRSMINFMQSHQHHKHNRIKIVDSTIWDIVISHMIPPQSPTDVIRTLIYKISDDYGIDKKNLIKMLLKYIIRHKTELITPAMLDATETLMRERAVKPDIYVSYAIVCLKDLFQLL